MEVPEAFRGSLNCPAHHQVVSPLLVSPFSDEKTDAREVCLTVPNSVAFQ